MIYFANLVLYLGVSYAISFCIDRLTDHLILKNIMDNGFAVRDGKIGKLREIIRIPNYEINKILRKLPIINIAASFLESTSNVYAVNNITQYALDCNIIEHFTKEEEEYYNNKRSFTFVSTSIHTRRKLQAIRKEIYEIKKDDVKKDSILKTNNFDNNDIKLIDNSRIDIDKKMKILEILDYSILNDIDNLNIEKLLREVSYKDNRILYYYYNTFCFKSLLSKDCTNNLLKILNRIINIDSLDNSLKENYIHLIYFSVLKTLYKTKKKDYKNIEIDMESDKEKFLDNDIVIKYTKSKKKKRH